MEIKHKVTGSLVMMVGEFSSVELELLLSLAIVSFGIKGNGIMHKTIGETFDLVPDSTFSAIADYQFASASVGCLLLLL